MIDELDEVYNKKGLIELLEKKLPDTTFYIAGLIREMSSHEENVLIEWD